MVDMVKVKELLGLGLAQEVVANAVGCSQAQISVYMSDADFATDVMTLRTQALSANSERDKKIDNIEDRLIEKLETVIMNEEIYKPRELLAAFHVVNTARRRGVPAASNLTQTNLVVQLVVPERLARSFTMTSQGEVTDVETDEGKRQTLVTMPTNTLLKTLAQSNRDGKKYSEVAKYLPTASASGKDI